MKRLIEYMVRVGFVIAWRFAGSPTFRSPLSTNATMDGVVLFPSLLGITTGSFPSITETQELVVPRSIPIIFPIINLFLFGTLFFSPLTHFNGHYAFLQMTCH
jgi:hypothetical protein